MLKRSFVFLILIISSAAGQDYRDSSKERRLEGAFKGDRVYVNLFETGIIHHEKNDFYLAGVEYTGSRTFRSSALNMDMGYRLFVYHDLKERKEKIYKVEDLTVEIGEFINDKKIGVFKGRFDEKGNFSGTWVSTETGEEMPFLFKPLPTKETDQKDPSRPVMEVKPKPR
ncbi:MAG: hypothetical protein WBV94_05105 [Blastocatellia bacterium]